MSKIRSRVVFSYASTFPGESVSAANRARIGDILTHAPST